MTRLPQKAVAEIVTEMGAITEAMGLTESETETVQTVALGAMAEIVLEYGIGPRTFVLQKATVAVLACAINGTESN